VAVGGEVVGVGGNVGSTVKTEGTPESLAQKYVNLGDFYFREERFTEAADSYARARTYLPNDASLHFLLADAVFATGDYHFAAFLIGEAIRLDPAMARADADKRQYYGKPATFEAQLGKLEAYLKDKPYDAMGWLVMGYNQKFAGHPDEAKKSFGRVLEIEPENRSAKAFLEALENPAPKPEAEKPPADRKGG
jgi:cytochrome c-type biogenesis protein CcmH/NrfG